MSKCLCCEVEFTPSRSYGSEQLYCSQKCANKARNERARQKFAEKIINEQKELSVRGTPGSYGAVPEQKENQSSDFYRGQSGSPVSPGGVVPFAVVEYLEKIYEQRFQEQVAAYGFRQQLEAMQKNNELIAAKLQEWEEDDEEEGVGAAPGIVAGIERLLQNDRFVGLVQMGFLAMQGKKIDGA